MPASESAAPQPDAHDQTLIVDNAVSLTLGSDSLSVVGKLPVLFTRLVCDC